MSSIPQKNHVENEVSDFVTKFFADIQVGRLLFKCSAGKEIGIPVDVFIIDDSLFDRTRSKNTELLAKVFDHCSMKFKQ